MSCCQLYMLNIYIFIFCPTLCIYLCIPGSMEISTHHNELSCMSSLTEKMTLATATNSIPDNPVQSSIPEPTSMTYTPSNNAHLRIYVQQHKHQNLQGHTKGFCDVLSNTLHLNQANNCAFQLKW